MFMRYQWGLAIGHQYTHKNAVAANLAVNNRIRGRRDCASPGDLPQGGPTGRPGDTSDTGAGMATPQPSALATQPGTSGEDHGSTTAQEAPHTHPEAPRALNDSRLEARDAEGDPVDEYDDAEGEDDDGDDDDGEDHDSDDSLTDQDADGEIDSEYEKEVGMYGDEF